MLFCKRTGKNPNDILFELLITIIDTSVVLICRIKSNRTVASEKGVFNMKVEECFSL